MLFTLARQILSLILSIAIVLNPLAVASASPVHRIELTEDMQGFCTKFDCGFKYMKDL